MAKTRITLIGCGFTGTVLGLAIKQHNPTYEVIGHDKDQAAMRRAEAAKAIDKGIWNLPSACEDAALVILAIPPDGVELTLKTIGRDLREGAIICALGGASQPTLAAARQHVGVDVSFISSSLVFHPERVPANSPIEKVHADMLKDAIWTISPMSGTNPSQSDSFTGFVALLNAVPVFMDALERDGLSLSLETLPALLASALMNSVTNDGAWGERRWLAGADFADATARIADPETLMQTLLAQKQASIHWLNQVMLQLMAYRDAISENNPDALANQLRHAKTKRDQWLADWQKGRNAMRGEPYRAPSLLGNLLGQRLADKLKDGDKRR